MPRPKKQQLKKRPDGRYRCVYKGVAFYSYISSDDAIAQREEYKRQERAGAYTNDNPTVRDYARKWLPLHKSVSAKCFRDYEVQLEALSEAIGDKPIKTVSIDDAALVWQHYQGYSSSTIKRARMLFIALFDTAVENDLCRRNPFRGKYAQPPKGPAGTHRVLTEEEIDLVKNTEHRVQLAAMIMLFAGLRRGEVLALTADDITDDEIIVSKAIRYDGNRPVIVAPKTASGVRRVPILSILRPYLESTPQRILASATGEIMTETAWKRAWDSYMHQLSRAAGHQISIRPHDLRHTYCTLLADAGVSIKQAMVWMGHSDEKMILHVYDHVTQKRTRSSIDQVEKMLLKGQNEGQSKT